MRIEIKLTPEDLRALISLSSESLPNVVNVASNIAIGIERAIIHAKLRNKYSIIIDISSPFPKNRSTALNKKFTNKINVIINNEIKNGEEISRKRYFVISRIKVFDIMKFIRYSRKNV
tara:strand:+ start:229 stop:582 length:354 start_codon:yes stop_codon:yes gene_type:complete